MVWGQVELLFVSGSGMFTIYGLGMGVWSYTLSALTALKLAANHKLESLAATARERQKVNLYFTEYTMDIENY